MFLQLQYSEQLSLVSSLQTMRFNLKLEALKKRKVKAAKKKKDPLRFLSEEQKELFRSMK